MKTSTAVLTILAFKDLDDPGYVHEAIRAAVCAAYGIRGTDLWDVYALLYNIPMEQELDLYQSSIMRLLSAVLAEHKGAMSWIAQQGGHDGDDDVDDGEEGGAVAGQQQQQQQQQQGGEGGGEVSDHDDDDDDAGDDDDDADYNDDVD